MSSHFAAPLQHRFTAWRAARLADRIERLEQWMERMPIACDGPSYATLAERVVRLKRRLASLATLAAPVRAPIAASHRPAFRATSSSATF